MLALPSRCRSRGGLQGVYRGSTGGLQGVYRGSHMRVGVISEQVLGNVHDLEVLVEYSMGSKSRIPLVLKHLQKRYHSTWDRWSVLEETRPMVNDAEAKAFLLKAFLGPGAKRTRTLSSA
eukprot:1177286-Prorocentrum_minimum.AAC.2